MKRLLIANRGEIAIRIGRAAALCGIETVAVAPLDDEDGLHLKRADLHLRLPGRGVKAYLDSAAMIVAAQESGCDSIHPGYGFLSENAGFAEACAEAGLTFVGPAPEHLALFGDKARARALAQENGVRIIEGTRGGASLREVRDFHAALGPQAAIMIKAVLGGGGRGMRAVHAPEDVDQAYERCASEAIGAFGAGDLYAERLIRDARHIEVQILGDGTGEAIHLWERDCTVQRRHQKLVEIAPAIGLADAVRRSLFDAALGMTRQVGYRGLATFEFLVEPGSGRFFFMEVNPRLQVEHTITEQITGIDLVATQLRLAQGASFAELGLHQAAIAPPRLAAIQLRINVEEIGADGTIRPASGRLSLFEPPGGPGVRVDSCGYVGYRPNPSFDTLLAKLIVTAPPERLIDMAQRALKEFRLQGVETNTVLLRGILKSAALRGNTADTGFVQREILRLLAEGASAPDAPPENPPPPQAGRSQLVICAEGQQAIVSPMIGLLAAYEVEPGQRIAAGQTVAIIEAMKLENPVTSPAAGTVREFIAAKGDIVEAGAPIMLIDVEDDEGALKADGTEVGKQEDLDLLRDDLAELWDRRRSISDEGRPEAVAKRHRLGQRTARENIGDLCDPGSFQEYGALMLAAQRGRRSLDELMRLSPADGTITGTATVNSALFPDSDTRCGVMAYDYTVFAGTQGFAAHRKMDRIFEFAAASHLPFVLFAEGGGGRPGDTDFLGPSGLDLRTFLTFGRLCNVAPVVGIASGRCFAGNAALLGCSHVIIATRSSTIGMAGPAMIEAGGLGHYSPEEVGPATIQHGNGVIDILVEDEAEAVAAARRYLSYFQGRLARWSCRDQRLLRRAIPESRLRAYDMRRVVDLLADEGSVVELRDGFGRGIITALIRIEGQPLGVVASNPLHLGGAIDADSADKAVRFLQLCNAFALPVLSLCDTPGFMVGPDSEKQAAVRHFARLFLMGGRMRSPYVTVVLRKGYGLGSQAMAGGAFVSGAGTFAWPSGEVGSMGIEGAVRLAFRKELEAVADPAERQRLFDARVRQLYTDGRAMNAASYLEFDDVIDPCETRMRVLGAINAARGSGQDRNGRGDYVDSW